MEPDILVGVKLLHTVIVCGDGGLLSGAVTSNILRMDYDTFICLKCDAHSYVSVLI